MMAGTTPTATPPHASDEPLRAASSRTTWLAAIIGCVPATIYAGNYVWLRATHELVRYGSGDSYDTIERANRLSGIGISLWEILYVPLIFIELKLRSTGYPATIALAMCIAIVAGVARLRRPARA